MDLSFDKSNVKINSGCHRTYTFTRFINCETETYVRRLGTLIGGRILIDICLINSFILVHNYINNFIRN